MTDMTQEQEDSTTDQRDIAPESADGATVAQDTRSNVVDRELSNREEIEAKMMMEGILPSFLTATRAASEGHPQAEEFQNNLIASMERNAKGALEQKGDGDAAEAEESVALWTAAADLCRAVFIEQRAALD